MHLDALPCVYRFTINFLSPYNLCQRLPAQLTRDVPDLRAMGSSESECYGTFHLFALRSSDWPVRVSAALILANRCMRAHHEMQCFFVTSEGEPVDSTFEVSHRMSDDSFYDNGDNPNAIVGGFRVGPKDSQPLWSPSSGVFPRRARPGQRGVRVGLTGPSVGRQQLSTGNEL
jgi:hypothetical protein